jgi:hypothetical protein
VSIIELPKVFKYADNETVAVVASERRDVGKYVSVRYAEVPAGKLQEFFEDSKVSAERTAKLAVPTGIQNFTLWIPQKESIFQRLSGLMQLSEVAKIRVGIQWKARADGKPRSAPRTDVVSNSERPSFRLGAEKMAGNLSQFRIRVLRYLSLRKEDENPRTSATGHLWSNRKVVCNRLRFERKSPWRLAAFADKQGLAFSKQYFAIWPDVSISEFALAAILSSPVANAFSFERDLDRDNHISTLETLPMPPKAALGENSHIHRLAAQVQQLLTNEDLTGKRATEIGEALIRLDAAVLESYDLSARVQRQMLNRFQGWTRPIAIPFTGYFPEHFKDALTLSDFVAIQYDWEATNEQRCDLIEKELSKGGLTVEERERLDHLQHLADLLVRLKKPYPIEELGTRVAELKANGKWNPST